MNWKYTDDSRTVACRALENGGMESRPASQISELIDDPEYVDPAPCRIDAAWNAADAHAKAIDENARFRYLAWLIDPTSSPDRRAKIRANLEWADSIWQQYAIVKAACLSGSPSVYDPEAIGPPPHTFWEIAES